MSLPSERSCDVSNYGALISAPSGGETPKHSFVSKRVCLSIHKCVLKIKSCWFLLDSVVAFQVNFIDKIFSESEQNIVTVQKFFLKKE